MWKATVEIGFKGVREGNAQQKGEGMTYWEKWRVEIENIGVEFNGKKTENIYQAAIIITVGKDGIPRICRYDCANCIFRGLIGGIGCVCNAMEWLKSEAEPEEKRMTNREKNKERLDELGLGDSSDFIIACRIAVRKNGDVDLCDQIPCHDCIFGYGNCIEEAKKWLEDEAEPDKQAQEKKNKEKNSTPKHKLFISCPTKGRTVENIKKSFEILKRTAEAYSGEVLGVVNPYEPKIFENDADRIRSLGDSIKLMADADYFITIEKFWEHTECGVENNIAGEYGVKRMLAMTEFVAPDVIEKSKNMVRNPYYNG